MYTRGPRPSVYAVDYCGNIQNAHPSMPHVTSEGFMAMSERFEADAIAFMSMVFIPANAMLW